MNIYGNMTFRTVQARDAFTKGLKKIQQERARFGEMIPRYVNQLENPPLSDFHARKNHMIYQVINELLSQMAEQERKLKELTDKYCGE